MDPQQIALLRLFNQQIAATQFNTASDLAGWMGALQAQDYAMVKWALGLRLPDSNLATVETAIQRGEILRTHLLRPTWHLVAASDIHWLLALTAPHIRALLRAAQRDKELSDSLVAQSNSILENAFSERPFLSREELVAQLTKNGIATDENRASHLLMHAELAGILCSGATIENKHTYALLEKLVPKPPSLVREEGLATLARRYFSSHAPATLQDFAWWSGLPARDARQALEMVKSEFVAENIGAQTYWFTTSLVPPTFDAEKVYLLPAFDEFIISYKDRGASLPVEYQNKMISSNGIFRPVVVINGQVCGIWKRAFKKDRVSVEANLFKPPDAATRAKIEQAAREYGQFMQTEAETVILSNPTPLGSRGQD